MLHHYLKQSASFIELIHFVKMINCCCCLRNSIEVNYYYSINYYYYCCCNIGYLTTIITTVIVINEIGFITNLHSTCFGYQLISIVCYYYNWRESNLKRVEYQISFNLFTLVVIDVQITIY